jgi:hypothetical protein
LEKTALRDWLPLKLAGIQFRDYLPVAELQWEASAKLPTRIAAWASMKSFRGAPGRELGTIERCGSSEFTLSFSRPLRERERERARVALRSNANGAKAAQWPR